MKCYINMIQLKESNENQCINFIPRKDSGYFLTQLRNEETKELIYNGVNQSVNADVSEVCDVFDLKEGSAYELSIYTTSFIDRVQDATIEELECVDLDFLDLEVVYLDKVFCVSDDNADKYKEFNSNEKKYKTI